MRPKSATNSTYQMITSTRCLKKVESIASVKLSVNSLWSTLTLLKNFNFPSWVAISLSSQTLLKRSIISTKPVYQNKKPAHFIGLQCNSLRTLNCDSPKSAPQRRRRTRQDANWARVGMSGKACIELVTWVWKTPVILFCGNIRWAISYPIYALWRLLVWFHRKSILLSYRILAWGVLWSTTTARKTKRMIICPRYFAYCCYFNWH